MNFIRSLFIVVLFLSQQTVFAQTNIKSPDQFLPHPLGNQFTRHDQLTDYFEYLAENAPKSIKLERYGYTNEERPLQIAIFASPENFARLENIRLNNLRLAGVETGDANMSNPPAIVWLSMSVHGNEASGSECSMELAYRLVAQPDPKIKEWLKNTVVILDPSLNPDGYSRYTNWFRSVSSFPPNPNPEAREHREGWPSGRTNHYHFDLNRDWAWATQTETQQRLGIYHKWLPHIHADLHEQYPDNAYYFAPAAEPTHHYITGWQRNFQTKIGENHAHYFDQNGWLYFTKEVFDLFYPSYGDTYPMFNGAIGMTYEQAGNSTGGQSVVISTGDTLTLHDRILHHLTTSLSTIEMGSKNAALIVQNFKEFYNDAATKPQGEWVSFVIKESNDPNKVNALCTLLDRHHIQYGLAGTALPNAKGFDFLSGKEGNVSVEANDLIISAYQAHGTLAQVLFEPEGKLADSLTYDITAWALPYAYGLEAYALKQRIEPKNKRPSYQPEEMMAAVKPYAWCIRRKSLAEMQVLGDLLQKGLRVRYATKAFNLAEQEFDAGTLVINRADNRTIDAELDGILKKAALDKNVKIYPILSGWIVNKGADLGSEAYRLIQKPEVALVYGEEVDDNSYGHTWFFFERELGYPITAIPLEKMTKARLSKFTTLIFPNGYYSLGESQVEVISDWVKEGKRLIAFDGGARAFADKDGFDLKMKTAENSKDTSQTPKPYQNMDRYEISDQLPGAIVSTEIDHSHPLAYGLPKVYHSLKTDKTCFEMLKTGNVCWLGDKYRSSGFIGSRLRPQLRNTLVAGVQRMGRGQVVYFVDNPLFRSFWYQGKMFLGNAVFF